MTLQETKLKGLCERYGFKRKVFSDLVYITSKVDEWFLKIESNNYSILYHKNNKHESNKYHKQSGKFKHMNGLPSFENVFKCISNHDEYVLKRKGANNIT